MTLKFTKDQDAWGAAAAIAQPIFYGTQAIQLELAAAYERIRELEAGELEAAFIAELREAREEKLQAERYAATLAGEITELRERIDGLWEMPLHAAAYALLHIND